MRPPRLSFEFFPPKSDAGRDALVATARELLAFAPDFVSVTWGALGAESDASLGTLAALNAEPGLSVAAHLTCTGRRPAHVHAMLDEIEARGVRHIVALRGDRPTGLGRVSRSGPKRRTGGSGSGDGPGDARDPGGDGGVAGGGAPLRYATDLVALVVARGGFEVSVSAYPETHPEAVDPDADLDVLARKFELGAARALTQFFFEPDTFLRFRDRAARRGIAGPIVPGILPVRDMDKAVSFAEKCGTRVPDALRRTFADAEDEAARERLSVEHATALCSRLVTEGVDELHFYTLNQAEPTREIASRLVGEGAVHAAA